MNIRTIAASVASATVLLASGVAGALWEPGVSREAADDSWQHGAVLLPVFFIATTLVCFIVGRRLLSAGHRSLVNFTLRASGFSLVFGLAVSVPSAAIGYAAGLLGAQTSIFAVAGFVLLLSVATLPAAALWWLLAAASFKHHSNETAA